MVAFIASSVSAFGYGLLNYGGYGNGYGSGYGGYGSGYGGYGGKNL